VRSPGGRGFPPHFLEHRQERLLVRPASIQRSTQRYPRVWVATYEWGTLDSVTTLFCAVDGTYGCLGSNGGGVLGSSKTDAIGVLGVRFLDLAERDLDLLHPVADVPPPAPPNVWQFIVGTFGGLRAGFIDPSQDTRTSNPLTDLWDAAQAVIREATGELQRRPPPARGAIRLMTDPSVPPRPDRE
jgi:hypothetical protein